MDDERVRRREKSWQFQKNALNDKIIWSKAKEARLPFPFFFSSRLWGKTLESSLHSALYEHNVGDRILMLKQSEFRGEIKFQLNAAINVECFWFCYVVCIFRNLPSLKRKASCLYYSRACFLFYIILLLIFQINEISTTYSKPLSPEASHEHHEQLLSWTVLIKSSRNWKREDSSCNHFYWLCKSQLMISSCVAKGREANASKAITDTEAVKMITSKRFEILVVFELDGNWKNLLWIKNDSSEGGAVLFRSTHHSAEQCGMLSKHTLDTQTLVAYRIIFFRQHWIHQLCKTHFMHEKKKNRCFRAAAAAASEGWRNYFCACYEPVTISYLISSLENL